MSKLIFAILWAALTVLYAVFAVDDIAHGSPVLFTVFEVLLVLVSGWISVTDFRVWRASRAIAQLTGK